MAPSHALFLSDVLVPASLLVNGTTILREKIDKTLFHIELERHGVRLAEGCPAENSLDRGNRGQFSNCPLAYDPVDAATNDPCAEVIFGGPRLEAIRNALKSPATT